jgi:hypothetical protein
LEQYAFNSALFLLQRFLKDQNKTMNEYSHWCTVERARLLQS